MPYRKNPKIDTIPDGLISTKEALGMLGIKRDGRKTRLANLEFAYVAYNKKRIKLFRRAEVEALLVKSSTPFGYISRRELGEEFGYKNGSSEGSYLHKILMRYDVPFIVRRRGRGSYFYPVAEARAALRQHQTSKKSIAKFASCKNK